MKSSHGDWSVTQSRLPRGGSSTGGPGGNIIGLGAEGGGQRFAVGEGRLLLLEAGQTQPAWDRADATLAQSSPAWGSTRQDPGDMLEDHRRMLVDAADADNQRAE